MQQQPFAPCYASEKLKPSNQFILFYEAPRSMLKALVADIQSHFSSPHTLSVSRWTSVCHSLARSPAKPHSHPHTGILGRKISHTTIKENKTWIIFIYTHHSIRFFSFISQYLNIIILIYFIQYITDTKKNYICILHYICIIYICILYIYIYIYIYI